MQPADLPALKSCTESPISNVSAGETPSRQQAQTTGIGSGLGLGSWSPATTTSMNGATPVR